MSNVKLTLRREVGDDTVVRVVGVSMGEWPDPIAPEFAPQIPALQASAQECLDRLAPNLNGNDGFLELEIIQKPTLDDFPASYGFKITEHAIKQYGQWVGAGYGYDRIMGDATRPLHEGVPA